MSYVINGVPREDLQQLVNVATGSMWKNAPWVERIRALLTAQPQASEIGLIDKFAAEHPEEWDHAVKHTEAQDKLYAARDAVVAVGDEPRCLELLDSAIFAFENLPAESRQASAAQSASLVQMPDVEDLANFIRFTDGNHKMGAGALAERIVDWLSAPSAAQSAPAGEREGSCDHCEPEGVFATDGAGPFDCYACGKKAGAGEALDIVARAIDGPCRDVETVAEMSELICAELSAARWLRMAPADAIDFKVPITKVLERFGLSGEDAVALAAEMAISLIPHLAQWAEDQLGAAWQRTQSAGVPLSWRHIKTDPPAIGQCVVLAGPQGSDVPGRFWRLTGIRREDGYYDSNGCGCDDATHWHELLESPAKLLAAAPAQPAAQEGSTREALNEALAIGMLKPHGQGIVEALAQTPFGKALIVTPHDPADGKGYSMKIVDAQPAAQDQGEVQRLREALNHIIRTCQGSRTSTRRLRWIEQRAQFALDGKPYSDDAFDLPKDATGSNEKLRAKVKDLRSLLNRVRLNVPQLQGMPGLLGDIEAELAASTGQEV